MLKEIMCSVLATTAVFGTVCTTKAESAQESAAQIIKYAVASDWDFDESYAQHLCGSIKKAALKNPALAAGWEKQRKYGELIDITQVEESTSNGPEGSQQLDVKAKMKSSPHLIIFRLWLQEEDGHFCIYAHNFFEDHK